MNRWGARVVRPGPRLMSWLSVVHMARSDWPGAGRDPGPRAAARRPHPVRRRRRPEHVRRRPLFSGRPPGGERLPLERPDVDGRGAVAVAVLDPREARAAL